MAIPRDFNGALLAEVEDEIRFKKARGGDHLCCPFQCPNCHSQNIRGRDLITNEAEDEAFTCVVIRATLDAFWSHSSKTVQGHVREVKNVIKYAEMLGIPEPFPRLGPFPKSHHLGMLKAGRTKGKEGVQYGTARKIRGTSTVIWDASPESGADITLSSSSIKGRYVATLNPSEGRWYQYFARGCCARMGDIV